MTTDTILWQDRVRFSKHFNSSKRWLLAMCDDLGMHNSTIFHKQIHINGPSALIWDALTNPQIMKTWMSADPLEITTEWGVGGPIVIRGNLHGMSFENRGTVLQYEQGKALGYSHVSSISKLPDAEASYSRIDFHLEEIENGQTSLTVTVRNFPTVEIYKHLAFYWNIATEVLKRHIEER